MRPLRLLLLLACLVTLSWDVLPAQGMSPRPAAEQAPALNQFPRDLGRNFRGLWSTDNLRPLLVGAAGAAAAIPADEPITDFFQRRSRWQGFDSLGKTAGKSHVLGPAIGLSFLMSRTTDNPRYQRFTYDLAQGFVITNVVTGGLKEITNRQRPDRTSRLSFLSGHTSNSFMWATVVSHHYGWKAGAPAYVFASYVGASRLHSRKHYLTDVVAGAALGYIVGRTVSRRGAADQERRLQWGVSVPPGGGAALGVGLRLW